MIRYSIEQLDTGLYYNQGTWAEEPEWFDFREAQQLITKAGRKDPSPLAIRSRELTSDELEGDD